MARDGAGRFATVNVHEDVINRIATGGDMRAYLYAASIPVVAAAKSRAPRDTGRGAEGLHTEVVMDAGELAALTSWEQEEFYMYWHEKGSRYLPARPFLVPALSAAAS